MPDRLFADERLAAIYDDLEGERPDLDVYEALVAELGAASVVDIGCGTGELACRLADRGLDVTGIDPAGASLDVARAKPPAAHVTWVEGPAWELPALGVDLAVMTGNVAQVFLDDADWSATLGAVHQAIRAGGHLVFETRDPDARAWEGWSVQPSTSRSTSAGPVECSIEVTDVALPYVSFRWTYRFRATDEVVTSDSTLRFRDESEIEQSLRRAGFAIVDVRDAPDRPGRELVFIAERMV